MNVSDACGVRYSSGPVMDTTMLPQMPLGLSASAANADINHEIIRPTPRRAIDQFGVGRKLEEFHARGGQFSYGESADAFTAVKQSPPPSHHRQQAHNGGGGPECYQQQSLVSTTSLGSSSPAVGGCTVVPVKQLHAAAPAKSKPDVCGGTTGSVVEVRSSTGGGDQVAGKEGARFRSSSAKLPETELFPTSPSRTTPPVLISDHHPLRNSHSSKDFGGENASASRSGKECPPVPEENRQIPHVPSPMGSEKSRMKYHNPMRSPTMEEMQIKLRNQYLLDQYRSSYYVSQSDDSNLTRSFSQDILQRCSEKDANASTYLKMSSNDDYDLLEKKYKKHLYDSCINQNSNSSNMINNNGNITNVIIDRTDTEEDATLDNNREIVNGFSDSLNDMNTKSECENNVSSSDEDKKSNKSGGKENSPDRDSGISRKSSNPSLPFNNKYRERAEHPAITQGRSSLIKYKANNKMKPKRKHVFNVPIQADATEESVDDVPEKMTMLSASSDENKSSGHASMSDGHTRSTPSGSPGSSWSPSQDHDHSMKAKDGGTTGIQGSDKHLLQQRYGNKNKVTKAYKKVDEFSQSLSNASGLVDIKAAIEHLTITSHGTRSSHSTASTYSSISGSESEPPLMKRLMRHSSLDTINTTVTSADEFVWIDSHNRLVEVQQLPWTHHDILKVVQNGALKEHADRVSMEIIPRLSFYIQRSLVRISREVQRLSRPFGKCSKQEVSSAFRIVLSPALANNAIKACLKTAAMYTVSGDQSRQSKSSRAGLSLKVGKIHQWMCAVKIGKFVNNYSAIYLTAGLENLLEEVILQCLPKDGSSVLSLSVMEQAVANNGDLWGLFQPYSYLNASRTANGTLIVPRCPEFPSIENAKFSQTSLKVSGKNITQALLTTCVGSLKELNELLPCVVQCYNKYYPTAGASPARQELPFWYPKAAETLYYFMRCSQLENAENSGKFPVQELVYERPYIVLPPIIEWVKCATAFSEYRYSNVIDKDDILQAARVLLPGLDHPPRSFNFNEKVSMEKMNEQEYVNNVKYETAFKMLLSGRKDLILHALQMLPTTKINTHNDFGFSPITIATLRGDISTIKILLESGANINTEIPPMFFPPGKNGNPNPEFQHWTPLTFATLMEDLPLINFLIDNGAFVEGGAKWEEQKCTETPLQLACAAGNIEIVDLLLSHDASPFLSTLMKDSMCFMGAPQKGCYCAIAVAAAHGRRKVIHKILTHPLTLSKNKVGNDVLSLAEILAEGSNHNTLEKPLKGQKSNTFPEAKPRNNLDASFAKRFSKTQIRRLQEAMYHSSENGNLEITLDLRNIGVPWTLYSWMRTLESAYDNHLGGIIDQLLQDFLAEWPEDNSQCFVEECLPLLFNIFRYTKVEGTTLLLADIFSICYGREAIPLIADEIKLDEGARIDSQYVNNPELSDVQFRVEGRLFYAHKLILVTTSSRFKSMLNSKFCEGNPPVLQINDIRFEIFEMVMQYLYNGGSHTLDVHQSDILELMAAANFFQLDGLLRYCEIRCSSLVDLDNIVSYYIHAKVYGAAKLLEYCQAFLLQNMVALLTYDDSIKRLIFGKKLQNHDVLSSILATLQERIRAKSANNTLIKNT